MIAPPGAASNEAGHGSLQEIQPGGVKRGRDKLQCITMGESIHESIPRAEVQVYPGGRAKGRNAFHVAQKDTKGPGLSLSGVPWVWGGGPRWGWSGQLKAY